MCYVLCLNGDFPCSGLSSLPSVDRNLSIVWSCCCCPWKPCGCPPLLYTSSILLHRFFSSMHFDAAWSFDAAPGYKYVGRRAYLLINQWQERSHARWKPAPCQSRMMITAKMIVIIKIIVVQISSPVLDLFNIQQSSWTCVCVSFANTCTILFVIACMLLRCVLFPCVCVHISWECVS